MEEMISQGKERYQEYAELLLQRDALRKEAVILQTLYFHTFGEEMVALFEEKIACIRCKKAITFCQQELNRGKAPDRGALQAYLEESMTEYRRRLQELQKDRDRTRVLHESPEYRVKKVKRLYRELAKLLHPDWNPHTSQNPVLLDIWQQVVTAYHANALETLAELDVMVRYTLQQLGIDGETVDIPNLAEKMDRLRQEIRQIENTDPYQYRLLLEDEEAVQDKHTELKQELEQYRSYHHQLQLALDLLLAQEGEAG